MFFHPIRNEKVKQVKISAKDLTVKFAKVGLKPISCISPVLEDFKNSFGWLRNDIQQFLRTSDPNLQAAIAKNLEVVNQSDANKDMTVQDLFDSIVPANVQTPAEIERFGRVLAQRYEGKILRDTKISDLVEKVVPNDDDKDKLDVQPEL